MHRFCANRWFVAALLFLIAVAVYWGPGRYIGSGDTVPAELLPISVLTRHSIDFNQFVREGTPRPYWFVDHRGRILSAYPIVPGLLNVPAFVIAAWQSRDLLAERQLISLATSSVVGAASVAFMYLCLLHICGSVWSAVLLALAYAFGTSVWSVASLGLWQHGPSVLFLSAALFFLLEPRERTVPFACLALGLAVFNRPANVVFALPLALYVWRHRRGALPGFAVLGAAPLLLMAWYSATYFDSITRLGQSKDLLGEFDGDMVGGLIGLLFSPNRGLLILCPILCFGLPYMLKPGVRPLLAYVSFGILGSVLLYSRWGNWWGGHSYSYRLLIELLPGLMLFVAVAWNRVVAGNRLLQVCFALCLTWGVYVQFLGATQYPCGFDYQPGDIDAQPERLWQVADGEIHRCTSKLLAQFVTRSDSLSAAVRTPGPLPPTAGV